jgi:hypothetical protein
MNLNFAAAVDYAVRGFSVIPFDRGNKAPALAAGEIHIYRERPAPAPLLRQWFVEQGYNVGVITGARWHLLVLDVDGQEGRHSLRGRENPPTPRVITRHGYHCWYRYDGPPVGTRIKALPGVDLLADGHQVLAPPSLHLDGQPAGGLLAGLAAPGAARATPAGAAGASAREPPHDACAAPDALGGRRLPPALRPKSSPSQIPI